MGSTANGQRERTRILNQLFCEDGTHLSIYLSQYNIAGVQRGDMADCKILVDKTQAP